MAQESCDLNKDEAEILKPSSSSAPLPPSPTTTSPPPPSPSPTAQIPEPQPPQSPPQQPTAQFSSRPCEVILIEPSKKRKRAEADADAVAVTASEAVAMAMVAEPLSPVLFVNRCNVCRKRVGLTGFRCRCEKLFCPRHRHSETHNCSFDYKTVGREEIARANPLIRAAKVIKI